MGVSHARCAGSSHDIWESIISGVRINITVTVGSTTVDYTEKMAEPFYQVDSNKRIGLVVPFGQNG